MKEDKIIVNLLVSSNIINMVCNDIADNKTNIQVTELLIEECGCENDRDINASINIMFEGLKIHYQSI